MRTSHTYFTVAGNTVYLLPSQDTAHSSHTEELGMEVWKFGGTITELMIFKKYFQATQRERETVSHLLQTLHSALLTSKLKYFLFYHF